MNIMFRAFVLCLFFCGSWRAWGQETIPDKASELEAKLAQTRDTSPAGGNLLVELVEHYHAHGRVFGLIRSGERFIKAQPNHPKHAEVMLKLLDGQQAASRDNRVLSTARQFLNRHNQHPKAVEVAEALALTLRQSKNRSNFLVGHAYEDMWKLGGKQQADAASRALRFYREGGSTTDLGIGGMLANELVEKLDGHYAADAAVKGVYMERRRNNHAGANRIALQALKKKVPFTKEEQKSVLHSMSENYRHLGQFNNAAKVMRQRMTLDYSPASHQLLIQNLHDMKAPAADLEREAADMIRRNPDMDRKWWALGLVAYAHAREENFDRASTIAAEIMRHDGHEHHMAQRYVEWKARDKDAYAEVEKTLRDAVAKNKKNPEVVQYALLFPLLRDRVKDKEKARAAALELVRRFPVEREEYKRALNYVLDTAPDVATLKKEVVEVTAIAKTHPEVQVIRNLFQEWGKRRAGDKNRREQSRVVSDAAKSLANDPTYKSWGLALDSRKGPKHRADLLNGTLTLQQRKTLTWKAAHGYSGHWKEPYRREVMNYLEKFAKEDLQNWKLAQKWLEAASHDKEAARHKSATEFMLKQKPQANDSATFIRLMRAAEKLNDKGLAKRCLDWIKASQKTHGPEMGYMRDIGNILHQLDMPKEATAYWNERILVDLNRNDARDSAYEIWKRTEGNEARRTAAEPWLKQDSDNHGAFSQWVAHSYWEDKKPAETIKVMRAALKRQEARKPRPWHLHEGSLNQWVDEARRSTEMSDADKRKVFELVRDLEVYRASALAKMALLETEIGQERPLMERLVAINRASLETHPDSGSWDHFNRYGERALARKDWPEAAGIYSAMLAHFRVDGGRETSGRERVARAYSKMGSLGLDVDANSPLAPLLNIGLHLRLGDREKALEVYKMEQDAFDRYMLQLPLEIVLFAADMHITAGGEDHHNRAEDMLRRWLIKFSEADNVPDADKAKVQLMLGQNYFRSGRYDVSRNEYTSVKHAYPDTEESIEAEFGIGEAFMAQKVFDRAEEIFTDLARSRKHDIAIRAEFLRGVLANRRGDRDEAREIFRAVLERVPDIKLANETLYNLAEVYGVEQRYMDQLGLLRTVGRLGQESKRWHVPGNALSIVVQDSDLGISRGNARIPVTIRTEPGGDREEGALTSGGAGKGLFMTEIDTLLGSANPGDGMLQLTGEDTVFVDYPEEFKEQFQFQLAADNEIKVASDATFDAASKKIGEVEDESFTTALRAETDYYSIFLKSMERPENQIKPGNPIYLQVKDFDQDRSDNADEVAVKVMAASGDEVTATLTETGPHTGIFAGTVKTGELPAGAIATDAAIDHSPLLAIDRDEKSYWQSEPDGVSPKALTVDMKDLFPVEKVVVHTPDAADQAPLRMKLEGSYDGRFWYELAQHPPKKNVEPLPVPDTMTRWVFDKRRGYFSNWSEVLDLVKNGSPTDTSPDMDLRWDVDKETRKNKQHTAVVWSGPFIQRQSGGVRFYLKGLQTALIVNGETILPLAFRSYGGSGSADVYLERGIHEVSFVSCTSTLDELTIRLAREDINAEQVSYDKFRAYDLDLNAPDVSALPRIEGPPTIPETVQTNTMTQFDIPSRDLRHIRIVVDEYLGEAVAINHLEVIGGEETIIPTQEDVVSLAANDELELTAGDVAVANYIDAISAGAKQRNRLIEKKLTATYYNASIKPMGYRFQRRPDGTVDSIPTDLMRIDPGERIGVEVTDFDSDETEKPDRVMVTVVLDDQELEVEAIETEDNSGIFRTEVDTVAKVVGARSSSSNVLVVTPGDTVLLRYSDEENTFPGHAVNRESIVLVNQPTKAEIRVIPTRMAVNKRGDTTREFVKRSDDAPGDAGEVGDMAGVMYELPLTVEVYDPDQAKNGFSEVKVDLTVNGKERQTIRCFVSDHAGEKTTAPANMKNWPLYEGRFVGDITLQLGGEDSPDSVPYIQGDYDMLFTIKSVMDGARFERDDVTEEYNYLVPVLNVTGPDIIAAGYEDTVFPGGSNHVAKSKARLRTEAQLSVTKPDYEDPLEILHVGEKLHVRVIDPDQDVSSDRDSIEIRVTSEEGESEILTLEETLSHSGEFTGSFPLKDQEKPTADNKTADNEIECFFGSSLTIAYTDPVTTTGEETLHTNTLPVAVGTDGEIAAFSKVFGDNDLALETQFHIAESYFELFKGHLAINREEEANRELEAGRGILTEVMEDYPDPKYIPRVSYLLGQFAQELEDYDEAIDAYELIVKDYGDHSLAADAQYKLAQCYENSERFDEALDAYVTLASTYPQSPLISKVMVRIHEYFYKGTNYVVAAQVARKFVERFEDHEYASRMAFRVGQCLQKEGQALEAQGVSPRGKYTEAAEAFDDFAKKWPDEPLCAEALFWSGEAYRSANNIPMAFRRYNRCRWDFPESEAAKYSRGRLALPELLAQFEREANLDQ